MYNIFQVIIVIAMCILAAMTLVQITGLLLCVEAVVLLIGILAVLKDERN